MWYEIAVLLFHLSILASGTISYCGSKLCKHKNDHTFCQFPPGPGPQCVGFIEASLSEEEKMRLLIRMNQRRAGAASGRLRRFPPATNMMKLTWIDGLAWEAQLWANQCEPPSTPEGHDACRDLYSVLVGQCVASVVGDAPGLRPESMVDLWYMQSMFYKGNVSNYTPPSQNHYNYYGDFAQLLYAQSHMVGCGRSRFMVSSSGRLRSVERLVCNFAPRGPSAGHSIWAAGSPAADCPPRSAPDANIPVLCAFTDGYEHSHNLREIEVDINYEFTETTEAPAEYTEASSSTNNFVTVTPDETVKKLPEELQLSKSKALLELSTTSISQISTTFLDETERVAKIGRAVIGEKVYVTPLVDRAQRGFVTDLQRYDSRHEMHQSAEDQNISPSKPPLLSMAMKYIPFFNEQKSEIFKSNSCVVYSFNLALYITALALFCKITL